MKNNLHLTLSNIIYLQSDGILSKILEHQNFLIKDIVFSEQILPNIIYKCQKNIIHHSLVDFLPATDFQNISGISKYKENNKDLIESIIKTVNKLKSKIQNKEIVIKSIYKGEKSIALEAFPSKDILKFSNDLANFVKTVDSFPKVKGFPPNNPQKFTINIIRFFRPLSGKEDILLNNQVQKINQKLKDKPIKFRLKKLSLVISDDYLSNPNPEIANFNIE